MTPDEESILSKLAASEAARMILPAAIQLIANGDAARFASTRAKVAELLERHKFRPGRASQKELRGHAIHRFRELRGQIGKEAAILKVADEFPTIENISAIVGKPSGRDIKQANELKSDTSCVGLESESNVD